MPDNIEYAYLGYGATLLILAGLVAWITWRYLALKREEQMVVQLEAELQAERAAAIPNHPEADPAQPAEAVQSPAATVGEH
jgi:hypothetical protein